MMSQHNQEVEGQEGNGRKVRFYVPITKSRPIEHGEFAGAIEVEGIATDESPDLDDESVIASRYPQAFDYLKSKGVFNLDHGKREIGKVTDVKWLTNEQARKLYAHKGINFQGSVVFIKGYIWPIADVGLAPDDLKQAHFLSDLARKGMTDLGFSIEGTVLERGTMKGTGGNRNYAVPKLVHRVAITTQPKNSNAICMVKSMADLVADDNQHEGEETLLLMKGLPDPEVNQSWTDEMAEVVANKVANTLNKSFSFDSPGISTAGRHQDITQNVKMTGAVPTHDKPSANTKAEGKGAKSCLACGFTMPRSHSYCGNCGVLCRSNTDAITSDGGKAGVIEQNPKVDGTGGKVSKEESKGSSDNPTELAHAYPTDDSTGVDAVKTRETDGDACKCKGKRKDCPACRLINGEVDAAESLTGKPKKMGKSVGDMLRGISCLVGMKKGDLVAQDVQFLLGEDEVPEPQSKVQKGISALKKIADK
jgi:hypothetical protein